MNTSADPVPPLLNPATTEGSPDVVEWLKRLLICNPFYLASAALLLFGLSRLTQDPRFLTNETRQVLFQFTVLQGYSFLLVGTALWLCRRKGWYDSSLLVVLENGLLLAPFLGISQAVLLDEPLAWSLALSGGCAVIGRGWSIRQWFPEFNLPDRARLIGILILAIHVGLPLIYRTRVDTDWHLGNRILWLGVLPLLALLPNLLPPVRFRPGTAAQATFLPLLIHGLWLAATAVHAWSIAWVDKTPTPNILLIPVLVASLWTLQWRHRDFAPDSHVGFRAALLVAAALAVFFPSELREVSIAIAASSALLFLFHAQGSARGILPLRILAWTAAAASILRVVQLLNPAWFEILKQPKPYLLACGSITGLILLHQILRSRNPVAGILGGFGVAIGIGLLVPWQQPHLAIQSGVLFALFHSLRWSASTSTDIPVGRAFIALIWTCDSLAWSWNVALFAHWTPCLIAALTSGILVLLRRHPALGIPHLLMGAAVVNTLIPPGIWIARHVPTPPLILGLSLVFFAAGTALALRRSVPGTVPPSDALPSHPTTGLP